MANWQATARTDDGRIFVLTVEADDRDEAQWALNHGVYTDAAGKVIQATVDYRTLKEVKG